jgi:hypothetical protein
MNSTTQMQSDQTINVNDQIVKFNNFLEACEYLLEEQKNRALPSKDECMDTVREYLSGDAFFRRIRDWIKRYKLSEISANATEDLKEYIGPRLDSYLDQRLGEMIDQKLRERGM